MILQDVLYSLVVLLFVIGLIILSAVLLKKLQHLNPVNNSARRLKVIERLRLDAKHQLLLIQRDQVEHLLLLGENKEIIIESHLK
jgi:flagellar biogenesis protein FliO